MLFNKNKDDCLMLFGYFWMDKDNYNGGRVDILFVFVVVLKLRIYFF